MSKKDKKKQNKKKQNKRKQRKNKRNNKNFFFTKARYSTVATSQYHSLLMTLLYLTSNVLVILQSASAMLVPTRLNSRDSLKPLLSNLSQHPKPNSRKHSSLSLK